MVVVQPSFVSIINVQTPSVPPGNSLNVTMPAGYLAGDVLLAGFVTYDPVNYGVPSAPPGWELPVSRLSAQGSDVRWFYKYATGGEGVTVDFPLPASDSDRSSQWSYSVVAYRNAADAYVAVSNASSGLVAAWTNATYNALVPSTVVSMFDGGTMFGIPGASKDAGSTLRSLSLLQNRRPWVLDKPGGPGITSGTTLTRVSGNPGDNSNVAAVSIGLRPLNSAPFAPTLVSMVSGQIIAVGQTNRAYHSFSDPDEDLDRPEGQSGFKHYHREVGAGVWILTDRTGDTNEYLDLPSGTFLTGVNYERQVECIDLAGEVGARSPSGFFTGGTAPTAPNIDSPTINQAMDANEVLAWTVATQTSYQYRRVADDGGIADPTEIYFDSGSVANGAARTAPLTFPVNNRFEHVQLRVWDGVLWSDWSSVRVEVAYTQPPAPLVTLLPVDVVKGTLPIQYTTPAPVGDQPMPIRVDIWIDDGVDIGYQLKADLAGLPLNGTAIYKTPRSGRDYTLRVYAIAYSADGIASVPSGALTFFLDSATRGVLDLNVLA